MGHSYPVLEVLDSGMVALPSPTGDTWHFPPSILVVVAPPVPAAEPEDETAEEHGPEEAPAEETLVAPEIVEAEPVESSAEEAEESVEPVPPTPQEPAPGDGVAIECWATPGESARARVERAMEHALAHLNADGVDLPDNIELVTNCRETQHANCFIYRFGTRRLHVSSRVENGGRLVVVVRCGGGFVDFLGFARRHGSIELIKMRRQNQGVLRLTSTMANGRVRVQERDSQSRGSQRVRSPNRRTAHTPTRSPSPAARAP